MVRSLIFQIRLSRAEFDQLTARAKRDGVGPDRINDYMRRVLLDACGCDSDEEPAASVDESEEGEHVGPWRSVSEPFGLRVRSRREVAEDRAVWHRVSGGSIDD